MNICLNQGSRMKSFLHNWFTKINLKIGICSSPGTLTTAIRFGWNIKWLIMIIGPSFQMDDLNPFMYLNWKFPKLLINRISGENRHLLLSYITNHSNEAWSDVENWGKCCVLGGDRMIIWVNQSPKIHSFLHICFTKTPSKMAFAHHQGQKQQPLGLHEAYDVWSASLELWPQMGDSNVFAFLAWNFAKTSLNKNSFANRYLVFYYISHSNWCLMRREKMSIFQCAWKW